MTIYELADLLNKQLIITYYPNQGNRFTAKIEGAEVKEDEVLASYYGNGNSPEEAISNYLEGIQGQTLVFNAFSENRQEYRIPDNV